MLLTTQISCERERGKTWHVINVANNWGKERKDLSGRRMKQSGKGVREIICQGKIRAYCCTP